MVVNTSQTVSSTVTPTGTTGDRTINTPAGTVNFAVGATSLTVTSSIVTTSSIIIPIVRTDDVNASVFSVVPSAGSFVIRLSGPPDIEVSVGFIVYN